MGWRLAKAARDAGLSGTLSDRARLALDHMCWTARDFPSQDQASAEYFAGSASLGFYLLGISSEEAQYKAADRALKELAGAGLIISTSGKGGRHKAKWRILVGGLWAPAKSVDNSMSEELF